MERFAKDGTDRAARILSEEYIYGSRATYHVFYQTKRGKKFVQACFAPTAAECEKWLLQNVRGATIIGSLKTVGDLNATKS